MEAEAIGSLLARTNAALNLWVHPAWLYVSVTGILVYVLLYHVYGWV